MKKIRNHAFGAIVTATTLAAVVLTGCGNPEDECEGQSEASSMSLVTGLDGKVGGGSGSRGGSSGGGSRGGSSSKGGGSKPGGKVDTGKSGKQKPGAGSGSSGGSVGGSGKSKFDDDDCED